MALEAREKVVARANPETVALRTGAMAEDVGRSETYKTSRMAKVATRKEAITAAVDEGLDSVGALRAMLAQRWMRAIDLLRDWDEETEDPAVSPPADYSKLLP